MPILGETSHSRGKVDEKELLISFNIASLNYPALLLLFRVKWWGKKQSLTSAIEKGGWAQKA